MLSAVILFENSFAIALVKAGVEGIEILGIQLILGNSYGIAESLIMHDLTGSEELDGITNVGIVNKAQNVVVGNARLLFCCNLKSASF